MARARREVWLDRVERWRASGLSTREFAAHIGVNANTLASWRWKLRRSGAEEALGAPVPLQFVEVRATEPAGTEAHLEVVLRHGQVVRVPRDFDETALRRLVDLLERR